MLVFYSKGYPSNTSLVANFHRILTFVLHVLVHFVFFTRSRMGKISKTGKRLSHLFWLYIML
jgi:hypothetical protein